MDMCSDEARGGASTFVSQAEAGSVARQAKSASRSARAQDDFTLVKKYHTHALTLWLCAEQVPARMSWTSGVQQ